MPDKIIEHNKHKIEKATQEETRITMNEIIATS
jgi:hypothetical protein